MIIKSLIKFYNNFMSPFFRKKTVFKKKVKLKKNEIIKELYKRFFNNSYKTVEPQLQIVKKSIEASVLDYDEHENFDKNTFLRIRKDGYLKNFKKNNKNLNKSAKAIAFDLFMSSYKKKAKFIADSQKLRRTTGAGGDLPSALKDISSNFFTRFERSKNINILIRKKKFFNMESKKILLDEAKDFSEN